jgi:hypothetical protein
METSKNKILTFKNCNMNTQIEIHDNNTNETGTYSVWYKDETGEQHRRILSENYVNALLDMRQKESFFMGKYRFKIHSEYDFKTIVLNGEKRQGLGN